MGASAGLSCRRPAASPRIGKTGVECGGRQRIRSASAAFTAGLAWKAPSTETEAMAARASSGVTSDAMLARPNTRMASEFQLLATVVSQTQIEMPARH
jgi:hypothetical protein